MKYGISTLGQIPVRISRAESSELVTQMLFGETCKVVDQKGSWFFVYTDLDQYLGWIDTKMIKLIPQEVYQQIQKHNHPKITSAYGIIEINDHQIIVSQASTLPFLNDGAGKINNESYKFIHGNISLNTSPAELALELHGSPYLWGGRTTLGIDCSGLIVNIFKLYNFLLPRDASEQVEYGETISFLSEAREGDVCFFDKEDGKIHHTGILNGNGQIIHASGEVRIDPIDHQGIYNMELKQYTHHLRTIKRFKI